MGIKSGFSYLGIYQTGPDASPMVFIPSSRPNYKIWVKNNGSILVLKYSKPRYKLVTFQVLMPKIVWGHMAWATWVKIWKIGHMGINYIYFPSKWAQDHFDRPTISASDVKFKIPCLGFLGKYLCSWGSKYQNFDPFKLESWKLVEKSSQKLESLEKNFGSEIRPLTWLSDDPGHQYTTVLPYMRVGG